MKSSYQLRRFKSTFCFYFIIIMNVYHSIALKEGRNYPFCQGRRTVWVPHRDTSCLQPAAPVTVTIYTNRAAVAAGMALCEG